MCIQKDENNPMNEDDRLARGDLRRVDGQPELR
jgi:hypothetical protein